jgi:hypothetical protein
VGGVVLCRREIALIGGAVARKRLAIAGARDLVALVGGVQACVGGPLALAGGALTDVTTELVCSRVDPGREVAITGGLVAVGGQLVAVGARLVAVGARLVAVGASLVAVRQGLVGVGGRLHLRGLVTRGRLSSARSPTGAVGRRVRHGMSLSLRRRSGRNLLQGSS